MEMKPRPMKRMGCSVENIGLYDMFLYEIVYYESCTVLYEIVTFAFPTALFVYDLIKGQICR